MRRPSAARNSHPKPRPPNSKSRLAPRPPVCRRNCCRYWSQRVFRLHCPLFQRPYPFADRADTRICVYLFADRADTRIRAYLFADRADTRIRAYLFADRADIRICANISAVFADSLGTALAYFAASVPADSSSAASVSAADFKAVSALSR